MTDVRCGAQNRHGEACKNRPARGRTRCRFHGGASTGPRTPEGLARSAENLRTHGFYSRLHPAEQDAALYEQADGEPTLRDEVRLVRAKLGALVRAGAGDCAILETVDAIRRLVAVERLALSGTVPPGTLRPFEAKFSVEVVGGIPADLMPPAPAPEASTPEPAKLEGTGDGASEREETGGVDQDE